MFNNFGPKDNKDNRRIVVCVDNGERRDQQHHQDRWPAVQGEIHECRVNAEAALWAYNDNDRPGSGWITHQGSAHQLHSPQLAGPSQTKLPRRIHYSACEGLIYA